MKPVTPFAKAGSWQKTPTGVSRCPPGKAILNAGFIRLSRKHYCRPAFSLISGRDTVMRILLISCANTCLIRWWAGRGFFVTWRKMRCILHRPSVFSVILWWNPKASTGMPLISKLPCSRLSITPGYTPFTTTLKKPIPWNGWINCWQLKKSARKSTMRLKRLTAIWCSSGWCAR